MNLLFDKLANTCHNLLYKNEYRSILDHYLNVRKISSDTIKSFKLGVFPMDLRLLFENIDPEELRRNDVIWNANESPFKNDKIHYPLVIPIQDFEGNTVAIGCRTLVDEEKRKVLGVPKYINTTYRKGAYLFGLDKAIDAIRKYNKVFVVEGYFDVISCHQAGIKNVVGTLGTSFGKIQSIMLSRYTDNINLLFDNDAAGRINSERVLRELRNDKVISMNVRCQFTPEGYKDIDEYLYHGGDFSFFTDAYIHGG